MAVPAGCPDGLIEKNRGRRAPVHAVGGTHRKYRRARKGYSAAAACWFDRNVENIDQFFAIDETGVAARTI